MQQSPAGGWIWMIRRVGLATNGHTVAGRGSDERIMECGAATFDR